MKALIC